MCSAENTLGAYTGLIGNQLFLVLWVNGSIWFSVPKLDCTFPSIPVASTVPEFLFFVVFLRTYFPGMYLCNVSSSQPNEQGHLHWRLVHWTGSSRNISGSYSETSSRIHSGFEPARFTVRGLDCRRNGDSLSVIKNANSSSIITTHIKYKLSLFKQIRWKCLWI